MSTTGSGPSHRTAKNELRQVRVPLTAGEPVELTLAEAGEGRPFLLLHGGGGPLTVEPFAEQFAADPRSQARVLTPTHPGFNGTARPDGLDSVAKLARLYVALLEELDLADVTVVGNSVGGWIAAEMAIIDSPLVSRYVIVDGVGTELPGHPVVDFFSLTPAEVAERAYHDPERYGIDPTKLPPEAQRAMAGNRDALAVYGGTTMTDPSLAGRLGTVTKPTLVVWGAADRIADSEYGRALAGAIPGARFELLAETGHLPQIETPEALIRVLWEFADRLLTGKPAS